MVNTEIAEMTKTETMDHIEEFAAQKLAEHNLTGWKFSFNKRKRSIGVCSYHSSTISVSSSWVGVAPLDKLEDTVLHEIAHAIAGYEAHHGPAWERACLLVGADPTATYDAAGLDPGYTWSQECPSCGKGNKYFRKPSTRRQHSCGACSGGTFKSEFLLVTKKI